MTAPVRVDAAMTKQALLDACAIVRGDTRLLAELVREPGDSPDEARRLAGELVEHAAMLALAVRYRYPTPGDPER
jgi:hypothetical protein